jgi:hypothetical protein
LLARFLGLAAGNVNARGPELDSWQHVLLKIALGNHLLLG